MALDSALRRDRLVAALAAAVLDILIGLALITALKTHLPQTASQAFQSFRIIDVTPPQHRTIPQHTPSPKPRGEASPPNRVSKATEVATSSPPVVRPSPIVAARQADTGVQSSSGAAPVVGPGSGSGGIGSGTGSGGFGTGGGGLGREAVQIRGSIEDSDIPRSARRAGFEGSVSVQFIVKPDGQATDCRIMRSSRNAEVDSTVCRLIEKRYRFRPALNRQGQPIASVEEEIHDFQRGGTIIGEDDEDDGQ